MPSSPHSPLMLPALCNLSDCPPAAQVFFTNWSFVVFAASMALGAAHLAVHLWQQRRTREGALAGGAAAGSRQEEPAAALLGGAGGSEAPAAGAPADLPATAHGGAVEADVELADGGASDATKLVRAGPTAPEWGLLAKAHLLAAEVGGPPRQVHVLPAPRAAHTGVLFLSRKGRRLPRGSLALLEWNTACALGWDALQLPVPSLGEGGPVPRSCMPCRPAWLCCAVQVACSAELFLAGFYWALLYDGGWEWVGGVCVCVGGGGGGGGYRQVRCSLGRCFLGAGNNSGVHGGGVGGAPTSAASYLLDPLGFTPVRFTRVQATTMGPWGPT